MVTEHSSGRPTMWRAVVRWWRYLGAKAEHEHAERADPKIQLTQALGEARANHARLTERAAIVVAHQKHLQRQLDRLAAEHERADGSARQALRLADAQSRQADPTKAAELLRAAEAFAERVLDREKDIRDVEQQLREAALATERAKAAVAANAEQLRQRVADRERLLSTLDQAKMQESINAALEQISGPTGDQVPTLAEVEHKIEARLARAQGRAELAAASSDPLDLQMLEIEQAQRRSGAQTRLEEMRITLGLATPAIDVASVERKELDP
jgi:phage shock protein A